MIIEFRRPLSVLIALFYFLSLTSAQTDESIAGGKSIRNEHNLSDQNYDIKVVFDHIFISNKNRSLEISEIVVFRNEGPEIQYSRDNHTFFAISTPPDAINIKTQVMECCLVQEEGMVYMDPMQPIRPGDNFEMKVSYTLLPRSGDYLFNKSAVYDTTSLSLFFDKKSGLGLERPYDTLTLQGKEFNVIAYKDLRAKETISVPIKTTGEPDYLYAATGLFILFLMGLIYHFKEKIFKRECTLEELELEKKKIFRTIHSFEKHAGPEKSDEFLRLMEGYRLKAIQIFIKIDKIKNK